MKKKTLDEQIDEDARALKDDIRRMGADLINTLRRARREAPAARRPKVRESATEGRAEPEPLGEHSEQPRRRFRVRAIRRPRVAANAGSVHRPGRRGCSLPDAPAHGLRGRGAPTRPQAHPAESTVAPDRHVPSHDRRDGGVRTGRSRNILNPDEARSALLDSGSKSAGGRRVRCPPSGSREPEFLGKGRPQGRENPEALVQRYFVDELPVLTAEVAERRLPAIQEHAPLRVTFCGGERTDPESSR
jgi:hypothetical protein